MESRLAGRRSFILHFEFCILHYQGMPITRLTASKKTQIPKRLSQEWIVASLALGIVAVVTGGWWWLVKPARSAYAQHLEARRESIARRETVIQALAQARTLTRTLAQLSIPDRERARDALPEAVSVADLVVNVETLVRLSGLVPETVNVATGETLPPPTNVPLPYSLQRTNVQVKARGGNYLTLKNFLQLVETNIPIFDIPALQFTAKDESLQLTLVTYIYQDR